MVDVPPGLHCPGEGGSVPAGGGGHPVLVSAGLLHQVPLAAYDSQLVLVRGGQVNGARGNCRAQVARVWDFQICSGRGPAGLQERRHHYWLPPLLHDIPAPKPVLRARRKMLTLGRNVPGSQLLPVS